MLKLNHNYSDYTDETDENYPEGKAINASSSESFDGTPLLAEFMNDINAAHIAMYEKAYGNTDGISGVADTQKNSQFAKAIAKYSDDRLNKHKNQKGLSDGVHGATSDAVPGQIACRDNFGNLKVGDAIDEGDAINRGIFFDIVNDILRFLVPVGSIKMYAGENDPKFYLICDGRAVSRERYSALFKVIGTRFGAGDGSTTFNLPDARECEVVGAGTSQRTDIGLHDALRLGEYRADSFLSHDHEMKHHHYTEGYTNEVNTNHIHGFTTGDMDRNSSHKHNRFDITGTNGWNLGLSFGKVAGTDIYVPVLGSNNTDSYNNASPTGATDINHLHSGLTGGQSANYEHSHFFSGWSGSSFYLGDYTNERITTAATGGGTTHGKQIALNYIIKY